MSNHTIGFLCGLCLWTIGLAACSPVTPDTSSPREYDVLGVIAELPEDGQSVVLSHETIPGFMQSMVMPFDVAESALLDGLKPGDDVWFHLVVRAERATIDAIKKIPEFSGAFPHFRLKTQQGELVDSSRLAGKVAIVNFWASWCTPCKTEIPWFTELRMQYDDADLEIIGVAQDVENADAIAELVAELGVS